MNRVAEREMLGTLDMIALSNVDVGTGDRVRDAAYEYRVELVGRICELAEMLTGAPQEVFWRLGNDIWKMASAANRTLHPETEPPIDEGPYDPQNIPPRELLDPGGLCPGCGKAMPSYCPTCTRDLQS